jgi:hypothetical protein
MLRCLLQMKRAHRVLRATQPEFNQGTAAGFLIFAEHR